MVSQLQARIRSHVEPKSPWGRPLPNPGCRCRAPLGIVILPGKHIHPCPVHPEYVIYGRGMIWS